MKGSKNVKNANGVPVLAPETAPIRTAAIWVPDWPAIAAMRVADISPHLPVAVMSGQHRVVAASAAARAVGVSRGMRKRTAQSHCPALILLPADEARDAAQFEPVANAAEQVVPGLEVMRPGILLVPAAGAARYHGSESELVSALIESVSEAGFECQVGVADGILAAVLAAREELIAPAGQSEEYLSSKPIAELLTVAVGAQLSAELTEAISLWGRLGIATLGDLVALPGEAMAGRFGPLGVWAQRLARGQDLRPPAGERPPEEISVTQKFDPPLYQVESAVVVGQELATQFVDLMLQRGLACGRVRISAATPNGWLSRVWRTDDGALGGMSAAGIAQRLRWQLDSWLTTASLTTHSSPIGDGIDEYPGDSDFAEEPAPVLSLEILAEEVFPASTYQATLWGQSSGADIRAARALGNVQGILGLDQVQGVALKGERTPWAREVRFAFGEPAPVVHSLAEPWPGALPDPAPSIIFSPPVPARLLDANGAEVKVHPRTLKISLPPTLIIVDGISNKVINWAGPWLVPQDWWEGESVAAIYLQAVLHNGTAYLLQYSATGWEARGVYD